jgi:uncharacterized protein YkwD
MGVTEKMGTASNVAGALFIIIVLGSIAYFCVYSSFTIDVNETEKYVFQYINEERAVRGLAQLGADNSLASISKDWSEHLASSTDEITHGNFNERMLSIGLPNARFSTGEIIAYFVGDWFTVPTQNLPSERAREFVNMWLNSPPHREIMLYPSTGYMGVGVSKRVGAFYGVVDFKFG